MELNREVLDAFSLKPKNIRKSKGLYIIEANNTTYKMRTIKISENQIIKSQKVTDYLEKNNINTTDKYINTTEDKPFYIYNDETYVLSKYLPLKLNDFNNKNNLLQTARTLAKFHHATNITDIDLPPQKTLLDEFSENIKDIKSIKKRVINLKNLKDFDLLFLKSSNTFLEKMEQTSITLNSEKYINLLNSNINNKSICHNNIKEENFELFHNDVYINNFMKIGVNDQLLDIASLVQRYLKVSANVEYIFHDIVNEYSKINQLSNEQIEYLIALCNYPRRYIKTVLSFYSKNRSFTPTGLIHKLEQEIDNLPKSVTFYK